MGKPFRLKFCERNARCIGQKPETARGSLTGKLSDDSPGGKNQLGWAKTWKEHKETRIFKGRERMIRDLTVGKN